MECGWIVTEVGRQPWIVQGVMRTEEAVTGASGVWLTFSIVLVLYAAARHRDGADPAPDGAALARGGTRFGRHPVRPRAEAAAAAVGRGGGSVSKADICAAILWVGATLYAVFGGADFGAGFWSLVGGGGERGERARRLIDSAIGPVWEANHVWLIFILVVLWTAFSVAFEAVMSTLFIPLCLAALGIVLRGSGFAFHEVVKRPRERSFAEHLFAASSVITPFFMGTVVGAIASGRVPVGNAAGDPWSSWLNPVSILIGVLFVATGAYLAAVFLITDARHAGDEDLERYFSTRALVAALVTGAIAVAGIFVLRDDARYVYDGLTSDALPLVIASALCGIGALVLIRRGTRRGARPLAVGAVVAVIWGWGVAQFPYLLPTALTISDGAGTGPTLTMVIIVFVVAAVLVLPALGLLYTLTQRRLLEGEEGETRRHADLRRRLRSTRGRRGAGGRRSASTAAPRGRGRRSLSR